MALFNKFKFAVIGSRDFGDYQLLCKTLEPYKHQISLIISGGARGADKLAEHWANQNNIPTKIYYADWDTYGKRAGYIRNEEIIRDADCVIAFWDTVSKGTKHSIDLAKKADKPIRVVKIVKDESEIFR